MTTGAFWNVDNPLKPWGYFDPNAIVDIPFDWTTWMADIGSSHASHTVTVDLPLEKVTSGASGDIVTVRIKVKAGEPAPTVGAKYRVTCHVVAADGQEDDQTVWLKILER